MIFRRKAAPRFISILALAVVLAILISMISIGRTMEAYEVYAETVDYYELRVGGEKVATFKDKSSADEIIKRVRDNYVDENANVVDVKITPALSVEKITVLKGEQQQPRVETNISAVLEKIIENTGSKTTYKVQEGDTPWDIAVSQNMSVEDLEAINPDIDMETLAVGDELTITNEVECMVNVSVEYEEVAKETVSYETVYEEDPEMYADEEEYVKTEGQDGEKEVVVRVVQVNGVTDSKEEVSSKVTKAPVNEVIVYGTLERESEEVDEEASEEAEDSEGEEIDWSGIEYTYNEDGEAIYYDAEAAEWKYYYGPTDRDSSSDEDSEDSSSNDSEEATDSTDDSDDSSSDGPKSANDNHDETFDDSVAENTVEVTSTSSGAGQAVVDYAMQFVGNPYVWGGISLTNGCDCSGFVYSVFNDCGYSINRWPDDDYPHVSASELKPGDICRYGGHYAIYIGDGMEISAVNEEQGIRTHPMYYSRSAFMYGIRVID